MAATQLADFGHSAVSLDQFAGELVLVHTQSGALRVTLTAGDESQPLCVTVPDVGASPRDNFAAVLATPLTESTPGKKELALPDLFRFAHVHHPGDAEASAAPTRVIGAPGAAGDAPPASAEELGDAVRAATSALLRDGCGAVGAAALGIGQGAGGYALVYAASQPRAPFAGLVLVSPLACAAGWIEAANLRSSALSLRFRGGVSNGVVDYVTSRQFGPAALGGRGPGGDASRAFRRRVATSLAESKVARLALANGLDACAGRADLVARGDVARVQCRTLVVCGVYSPHRDDALALSGALAPAARCAFVEADEAGPSAAEEAPGSLKGPLRSFAQALRSAGVVGHHPGL